MYSTRKVFAAACAGMTLFGMAMLSLGTVNTFLAHRFSLDQMGIGSLAALLPFGILTGSLILGPVVDRFGYKSPLATAALILSAGFLMVARAESFPIVQTAFFVIGLGGGVLNGGTNALVADISGESKSARLSLLGVFFGVGALGMPALTGLLLRTVTPMEIISWFALAILLPLAYMLAIRFPSPKQHQGFPLAMAMTLVRDRTLILLAMILFFESAAEGLVSNWTPAYFQGSSGLEPEIAIFMLTVLSGSLTGARLVLGWALRRAQPRTVLIGCLATAGVGTLLLALTTNAYLAAGAMVLLGIGFAAAFPVIVSFIAELFPGLTGTAIGIALIIALTGNMALNYGVGAASQAWGIGVFPGYLIGVLLCLSVTLLVGMKSYALRKPKLVNSE